jgi:hypothetical protein
VTDGCCPPVKIGDKTRSLFKSGGETFLKSVWSSKLVFNGFTGNRKN